jgi:hypothetical protein
MIYDFSLHTMGIVAGALLLVISLPGFIMPPAVQAWLKAFPRSRVAGVALLTLVLLWAFWLLATMEMGEFSSFRKPLLIVLPIGYVLVIRFVEEFLAVRALGILCLLAAEPMLEAGFFRWDETSRLFVTVFAYLLIIAGLFWVTMPYLLRDQINWSAQTKARWHAVHAITALYGIAILACALTKY